MPLKMRPESSLQITYLNILYYQHVIIFLPHGPLLLIRLENTQTTEQNLSIYISMRSFMLVIRTFLCFQRLLIKYIKLRSLENESLVRRSEMKKLTFARDQYQKYTSATQTRRDYIASMGYKFSARTDLWIQIWFHLDILVLLTFLYATVNIDIIFKYFVIILKILKKISCSKSYFHLPVVSRGQQVLSWLTEEILFRKKDI